MPVQAASCCLTSRFDEPAIRRAVEECRRELGGPADLAVVFASPDFRPHLKEFAELVQVYGHAARVVGCSTSGQISPGREDEDVSGFTLLLLNLGEQGRVVVSRVTDGFPGFTPEVEDLVCAVGLFHPFRFNAQSWLLEWNTFHPTTPCYGGLASGGSDERSIFIFDETGEVADCGLVVEFQGPLHIEGLVSQGCRPIGRPVRVDEVRENLVLQLDDREPYQVLNEAVAGLLKEGIVVTPGSIHAGLAVKAADGLPGAGDYVVRNILAGDPATGVLQIGAHPQPGQTLQFQFRDADAADEDLREGCRQLRENRPGRVAGALLFSCSLRGQAFFEVPNHDAGLVEDSFGTIPLAGAFCHGELGPVGVSSYLHGYTAVGLFFYADPPQTLR